MSATELIGTREDRGCLSTDRGTVVNGKDEEFTAFVAARQGALLRYAYLLTGNRAQAEDLLQTTLVKVYLAYDRISDRGSLEAYTKAALVRNNVSWWRRASRREVVTDELPERVGSDHHDIDERDELWRLLSLLGPRQRAVLVLRFYEDLPEAAIAETLGCTVGTVKSQLHRGLAHLRTHMAADAALGKA